MNGRVVSNKTLKTVTVLVESRKTHPLYKKTYAWSKKYLVHDEVGAVMGDLVEIAKSRPFSKRKHWQVVKIVGRDIVPMNEAKLKKISQEHIEEVMPEEKVEKEMTVDSEQSTEETVEAEVVALTEEKGEALSVKVVRGSEEPSGSRRGKEKKVKVTKAKTVKKEEK